MSLAELAEAKLAGSCITVEEAKYAGIKILEGSKVEGLFAGAQKAGALQINYLTPEGKPTGFYRVRYLEKLPGLRGQAAKPLRYQQPPNTAPGVYFPRVKGVNWMSYLADESNPIIITEGELKALCATVRGMPTIALGGVWSFKSAKEGRSLLEDLEAIPWKDRTVYVVYDSDAVSNPKVVQAAVGLATTLGERGAAVFDAGIPQIGDTKTGLDDYLFARSNADFVKLLDVSEPFEEVLVLHRFNQEYLYIKTLDAVVELSNRQMYAASAFRSTVAANQKYDRRKTNAQGQTVLERRSAAKDWLEWPNRAQAEKVDYAPGEGYLVYPGPRYNTWRGWGAEPKKGDVRPWQELLQFVTNGAEPEAIKYLEQWFAYPIAHPGAKLFSSVAIWGVGTGTGKTLMGESMLEIYGEHGGIVGQDQLQSPYSSWLDNRQFILGDEITGSESRHHADKLKGLITSKTITINKKYVPEYDLPNRVNFYFTSNHPDAFFLERRDRRFLVFEAPYVGLSNDFYRKYVDWLRNKGGKHFLMYHLAHLDLGGFDPAEAPPETAAKRSMIEENLSELGVWVDQLKSDADRILTRFNFSTKREIFSSQELLMFFDPENAKKISSNGMGRELKRAGFMKVNKQVPLKTNAGTARFYAIRNTGKWMMATTSACIDHINKHALFTESKKK